MSFFFIHSLHIRETFMEDALDIRHSTSVGYFNGPWVTKVPYS